MAYEVREWGKSVRVWSTEGMTLTGKTGELSA